MNISSKVSVVVPVYKVEAYLDRCVQTLVNQTYQNLEIILVDDGSPDRCPALCDEWAGKDSRIKVVHKENGGLSSARNAGMAVATGEYIMFTDSDDWVELNMVAELYSLLQQYPDAGYAQCDYFVDNGKTTKYVQKPKQIIEYDQMQMYDMFFRVNGEPNNTSVWNKLIRKEVLDDFQFIITLYEDVEASYDMIRNTQKMVSTNQKYYHYWYNAAGISNSPFRIRDMQYLSVWDRMVDRVEKELPEYLPYAVKGRKRASFTFLARMRLMGCDKTDPELKRVHKQLLQEVRKNFFELLKIKMPLNRKVLLMFLVIFG